ncbi:MAG TPA: hypothetical protein VN451_08095 [Chitinophagaceae bacterium]|nr:hypothetical protein [Chitinophagaceae bacterium]
MINQSLADSFSIFIRLDEGTVYDYFNSHDPAPLYKRQLGHEFEQYIYNSILTSKRNAVIQYQVVCLEYSDKRFIEPVTKAIRSHFNLKKFLKELEFKKFKSRTFKLLCASLVAVLFLQALVPFAIEGMDHRLAASVHNIVDVFSWVIMWKPIDRLIFYWNPFKKDIHLLDRLANAGVNVIEKQKSIGKDKQQKAS